MKHKEKNDNGLNFLNLMIIISLKSSENQKQNACTENQIWHNFFFFFCQPVENKSTYKILNVILGWKNVYILYSWTRIDIKGYFSTERFNNNNEITFKILTEK